MFTPYYRFVCTLNKEKSARERGLEYIVVHVHDSGEKKPCIKEYTR